MTDVILKGPDGRALFIDVSAPTPEDYALLRTNFKLPDQLLDDCMDPMHLPKVEKSNGATFIIVRSYDEASNPSEDSVQAMTRKIAMFIGEKFLISIHRKEQSFLNEVLNEYRGQSEAVHLPTLMLEILLAAVETYLRPLEDAEDKVHRFESSMLRNPNSRQDWEQVFITKSRLTVIKRMLWHILNSIEKFVPQSDANMPAYQELRERIHSLQFFTDSLLDTLNNLLNIQVSLASHSTNEVIRMLTLFSAFFMPLTFIVGIYGMNFEHMPELKSPYGYAFVWTVMMATALSIYLWFRRKGWIK